MPDRAARLEIARPVAGSALVPALDQTRTVGTVTLPGKVDWAGGLYVDSGRQNSVNKQVKGRFVDPSLGVTFVLFLTYLRVELWCSVLHVGPHDLIQKWGISLAALAIASRLAVDQIDEIVAAGSETKPRLQLTVDPRP
jgi:hypothetical protein